MICDAVKRGHGQVVRRLIRAGANVNAKNSYGIPLLLVAAFSNMWELIPELIGAGALAASDYQLSTALSGAARRGCYHTVRALLHCGANPNTPSVLTTQLQCSEVPGRLPEFFKVCKALPLALPYPEIVKVLVEAGADVNDILLDRDRYDILLGSGAQGALISRTVLMVAAELSCSSTLASW